MNLRCVFGHRLQGSKCVKCGKILLPKILVSGHSPATDFHWYIQYTGWAADFYEADIPSGWASRENFRIFQERPNPSMSTPAIIEKVKKEWPYLTANFSALDVQVVADQKMTYSLICFVKVPRLKPPKDDPRYPSGYFPHRFTVDFMQPPSKLSDFLQNGGYRHTSYYRDSYEITFDSHDEVEAFVSELNKLTQDIPLGLRKCRHGLYKTARTCKLTCTSEAIAPPSGE